MFVGILENPLCLIQGYLIFNIQNERIELATHRTAVTNLLRPGTTLFDKSINFQITSFLFFHRFDKECSNTARIPCQVFYSIQYVLANSIHPCKNFESQQHIGYMICNLLLLSPPAVQLPLVYHIA